jgi:hypothetical protein
VRHVVHVVQHTSQHGLRTGRRIKKPRAIGLLTAACGFSSNATTSSSPAASPSDTTSTPGPESPTAASGMAEATAYLGTVTANPTKISFTTPVSGAVPREGSS